MSTKSNTRVSWFARALSRSTMRFRREEQTHLRELLVTDAAA